jgi:5-methylcytosine-specific restriction endonuclease McrA
LLGEVEIMIQGTTDADTDGDTEAEIADWKRAHGELVRLAALRASLDWDEGRSLLSALRFGAHLRLGFGSFAEYVERLFGYRPRFTQERLRVAEALEELPLLDGALRDGELCWSAVRELTRVATLTTEQSWIASARGRSLRDVEKLVSGRKPGDRPSDPASPGAKRHTLRFEVTADVLATFRDAMAKLRRDTGGKLDDDEALLLMARQVLGGPMGSGRSSYQVSVSVCDRCRQGYQQSSGERLEVGAEVVAMAECDAQQLGRTHVDAHEAPAPTRVTQTVPPAVRRRVLERDGRKCSVPGCRHGQYLDLHHVKPRAEGGDHDPELLVTLCGVHHRAAHMGALVVTGTYSSGFVLRHADGKRYGSVSSPETCEVRQKVFLGLKGLGFRESDARRALEAATSEAGTSEPWTAETLLRKTLAALT